MPSTLAINSPISSSGRICLLCQLLRKKEEADFNSTFEMLATNNAFGSKATISQEVHHHMAHITLAEALEAC
jgi:hypothetical protein